MGNWFFRMIFPVFFHGFVMELTALLTGGFLDASARVLLASAFVIPAAWYLCRKDEKRRNGFSETDPDKTWNPHRKNGKEKNGGCAERKDGRKGMGRKTPGPASGILCCVLCFASGGLLNLGWSGLLTLLKIQQHFSNAAQEALLSGQAVIQVLSMGFFAPLAEELIFRALVYRRMREMLPAGRSVLLSSLLFAVYHGNVIQMVFAFPMAVVLTLLYEKSGKFRYPLLFHMGCNLTAVVVNFI